jgi:hypothetical protein
MLAVKAGHRRELVKNPTTLSPVPLRIPPVIAATNSSRAAMLIRLMIGPAMNIGREQIR